MDTSSKHIFHNLDAKALTSKNNWPVVAGVIVGAIILGILSGYGTTFMSSNEKASKTKMADGSEKSADAISSAGILDKETFKDKAEGVLKEGGFEGEGSFHLERPGGISQNVYLTSTTVDLTQFLEKDVRLWGATFDSKKAGWLMDVGYIEIIK
ncbi:hypothetical protein CO051_01885 [Candidatus Roizmanbacteria bacterium CG_4_9_14_0_2_um_filter_39_13]|uniref:Uncharacterized protein n=1 Tax=Candidatus Roizmanbacteria bacterium CG_4_9_14_0_2_um_filter_39_13 TaxID=1974839 RepID=A0A2M8F1P2_9BACT|nr:MAG: hypothetical protein COY15_03065 [Candidatus Roizmanbacteria bacterium CG_4_10_14_0_2_um_filter_39_12]PJC33213.1 MAG: hypothetical protein CO051_01885 [Candidatus Roizmanbacteria bacterium CG_4_9_14_0_2_um_filter_39_13]